MDAHTAVTSNARRSSLATLKPTQPGAETQATRLVKHSIIAIEAGDVAIDDEAAAEEDPLSQLRTAAEAAIQPPGTPDAGESMRHLTVKNTELSIDEVASHPILLHQG